MNTSLPSSGQTPEAQFGRRVAARLSAGTDALPHDIGERLRVARSQALARRKLPPRAAPVVVVASGGGTAAFGSIWWTRLGAVVPLVALVAGLISISVWQDDQRTSELAELDSALLTDALPPAAYTDPGFAQFLKSDNTAQPR